MAVDSLNQGTRRKLLPTPPPVPSEQLRRSADIEPILLALFDLLTPEDYRLLFASVSRQNFTYKWLEIFSKLCMQRYLELDEIFVADDNRTHSKQTVSARSKSIVQTYTQCLIDNFKSAFSVHCFHAIVQELEQLNRFKVEQISKQISKNNALIHNLLSLFDRTAERADDAVIHLSSTIAQPTYRHYRPSHMIFLRTNLFIRNAHDSRLPVQGVSNTFVANLIETKTINVLNETTKQTFDVPTEYLYFSQACEPYTILPLKLRVLIVDGQTGGYRVGIIGEEPGKNNCYRCLIFFTDDKTDLAASYYPSSDVHVCLNQAVPVSSLDDDDDKNDVLHCYFKSYPERLMLRVKEGTTIRVRSAASSQKNVYLPATVVEIDCSMILIEFSLTKQRVWIYRGSTSIEQMNTYYSTQTKAEKSTLRRHTARQHLSAKKSNAPEIICLNDQMKAKTSRTAELASDETGASIGSSKRPRVSREQGIMKYFGRSCQDRSDEQHAEPLELSSSLSTNAAINSVQFRSHPVGLNQPMRIQYVLPL